MTTRPQTLADIPADTPATRRSYFGEAVTDAGPIAADGPDGQPMPNASTVHVLASVEHVWADGPDRTRYYAATLHATVADHSRRDSNGRSGVTVATVGTSCVTDPRRVARIGTAAADVLADRIRTATRNGDTVPAHCARAVRLHLTATTVAALAVAVDRARSEPAREVAP